MERKQFTFYRSFWTAIRKLPQELWLAYLVNIITYALDEELLLDMNSTQAGMFELVRPNLDAARKKASAGAEGGRRKKASKQVSKKENEMENENEIELENELENELEHKCVGGDGFEKFWDLYPVKIAKNEAHAVWKEKMPDTQTVLKALEAWMRSKRWTKDGGNYIPRAGKFLEQEYYLQAPEVETGATGRLGQAELEAIAKLMKEY